MSTSGGCASSRAWCSTFLNDQLRSIGLQFGPRSGQQQTAPRWAASWRTTPPAATPSCTAWTADHVLETEVLLSDGSRASFAPVETGDLSAKLKCAGLEGDIYRAVQELTKDETNQETIRQGTPKHWRRCGGYNLDHFVSRWHPVFATSRIRGSTWPNSFAAARVPWR